MFQGKVGVIVGVPKNETFRCCLVKFDTQTVAISKDKLKLVEET